MPVTAPKPRSLPAANAPSPRSGRPAGGHQAQREIRLPGLVPALARVHDPRARRGVRHPLATILTVICFAWLSGIAGYVSAHQWCTELDPKTRRRLGLRRGKVPAASTLYLVLSRVDPEALENELRTWVNAVQAALLGSGSSGQQRRAQRQRRRRVPEVDPQAQAIDGKALRGSWKRGAKIAGLLAVVSHELAFTLAQTPLSTKEGELTAVRPLLEQLLLEEVVITVDAQFTQPDIAATICRRGGDYVMRVKLNQPTLLSGIREFLSAPYANPEGRRSTSTFEKGHGRIEARQLVLHVLTEEQQTALGWPGAQQIFAVISHRTGRGKPGKTTAPTLVYGITSLTAAAAGPERMLRLYRGHWTVENRGFWVRDVVFREDASPAKAANNVAVLACLRGGVMNVARAHQGDEPMAAVVRRFNANRTLALDALGCP